MSQSSVDFAVVGAGPAGLSAASMAAKYGAKVVVLDEQGSPGGQIYRKIEQQEKAHLSVLGPDYAAGFTLTDTFRRSDITYIPQARVWTMNGAGEIGVTHPDGSDMINVKKMIIASGAMERPVPFPGWTLPGVMNAGAGQVLFKAHQLVPSEDVVLAGSGPLLLLLAWQYLRAGIKIQALLDLTPMSNHFGALKHLPKALLAHRYLRKGLFYEWQLKRAGIKILRNITDLRAIGDSKLTAVQFTHKGQIKVLNTEHLLVHFGVIPVNHLSQVAGCSHHWHESQQCWRPDVDEWGLSSDANIYIAGDGAGIAGAKSAEFSGSLAALHGLSSLGQISETQRDNLASPVFIQQKREQRIRPFLEAYFRIPDSLLAVKEDQTIVCRCEEVSAATVRKAVKSGHQDNNQVKFLTRCGMGPCQGRQCSAPVSHIVANTLGTPIEEAGYYRARPPVNSLSLQELAAMFPEEQE